MPRKNNPVDALKKLREQRDELAAREAKLREEAALVLGHILIECGAETIEPAQLRQPLRSPNPRRHGVRCPAPPHRRRRKEKAPMVSATGALLQGEAIQSSSMSGAPSLVPERPLVRKSTLSAMISQP